MEDNYIPFQGNYQQNDGTTYIPFQDGIILESQSYYSINGNDKPKCEYCGKPAQVANCHAHEKWCPYSCDYNSPVPIGDSILPLMIISTIYLVSKTLKSVKIF